MALPANRWGFLVGIGRRKLGTVRHVQGCG